MTCFPKVKLQLLYYHQIVILIQMIHAVQELQHKGQQQHAELRQHDLFAGQDQQILDVLQDLQLHQQ